MSRTSATRRRLVAVASAVALAFGGVALVANAPAAHAAPATVKAGADAGNLTWGVKASFRSYIRTIAAGTYTPGDGAALTAAGGPITFPSVGGSYDPVTKVGNLDYSGKVVFRSVAHTIWNITFANPTVVLTGTGTGKLLVDVSYATGGTESAPEASGTEADVDFGVVAVAAAAPSVSGSTYTFTNQAVTLTEAGEESFNGQYEAGTAMDPLTATAVLQSPTPTTPPTTPTPTNPPTSPAPNPLGALVAGLLAGITALLTGLGG